MVKFLLRTIEELLSINVKQDAPSNGRRMLSAIVIASCIHYLNNKFRMNVYKRITDQQISQLLSLFCLMPNVQNRKCEDWELLSTVIPEAFKIKAGEAVSALINHLNKKKFSHTSWLFAIPTAHFLKGFSVPFQDIELDIRKIQWEDQFIDLATVREKTHYQAASM